jgi:hypothetical protein
VDVREQRPQQDEDGDAEEGTVPRERQEAAVVAGETGDERSDG